jgi:hypothetical protein
MLRRSTVHTLDLTYLRLKVPITATQGYMFRVAVLTEKLVKTDDGRIDYSIVIAGPRLTKTGREHATNVGSATFVSNRIGPRGMAQGFRPTSELPVEIARLCYGSDRLAQVEI